MKQSWHDLLFMHWRVSADALRARLPDGLELDTFHGEAWLGVVPFRMTGIRLDWFVPIPGTSAFAELNVRTYVTGPRGPAVWFFSLDAASPLAVAVARRWYHLPYFNAEMDCEAEDDAIHYVSVRTHRGAPPAEFAARYAPTGPVYRSRKGDLDHWLTERYALYAADKRGRLRHAAIEHEPWPLQPAEVQVATNSMTDVELEGEPLLHFARRIDVSVRAPRYCPSE
jgi:uncharacterized protein YqjF (DUF2071 family)